ncbi:MAG: glycosyltransferase family protein [Melioribacter sp.]|uniref:glycosyltransferase family protein n=1 Tax=Rosettibacter primus TaxID=3111523 RepID=UPI00247D70C8|nr:glycosyltransferase family protein [Melioribacter sp.]
MNKQNYPCNISAIVQARTGSTRLPNKIFKELCGKPILWHVINRLSYSKLISQIIIATTILPEDDTIEEFCKINNILFYRGSSDDVLSRYYETAKKFNAEIIIRITSDCPVIDPQIIDKMINNFFDFYDKEKIDYMSNTIIRTFPRGLDAEIFPFNVLEKTHLEAKQNYEREHVTPYIYQHPEIFKIKNFACEKDYSFHRWTVDTIEDFELIEKIYESLYKENDIFYFEDILKLFEKYPDLVNINKDIKQKQLND